MTLEVGLYLLPNLLDKAASCKACFPPIISDIVPALDGLIAESEKGARYFLNRFTYPEGKSFREVPIALFSEHSTKKEICELLIPLKRAERWGLISDAGLPILADPGADLVFLCRTHQIPVHSLPGPSSILYALMLSGFSAQNFAFHGYLPRDDQALRRKLIELDGNVRREGQTQLFIEAPYRNVKLLTTLIETLKPTRWLAVLSNLTAPTEEVVVKRVAKWKQSSLSKLKKVPAIFAIGANREELL